MITKEQALTAQEFHYGECTRTVGPRGGVKVKQEVWRRNGQTQVWKTRPNEFRVPIKYGLKACSQITQRESHQFHAAEDCPLNHCEIVLIGDPRHAKRQQAAIERITRR